MVSRRAAGFDGAADAELAHLAALATLPGMGPMRLARLRADGRTACDAWRSILDGSAMELLTSSDVHRAVVEPTLEGTDGGRGRRRSPAAAMRHWQSVAVGVDPEDVWRRHVEAGVAVVDPTDVTVPACFAGDPAPPAVLFAQGDLAALAGPRVAIVGTRDCTHQGHELAFELGRDLSAAGVRIVSGLALGIDGAAHAGALEANRPGAPPVAVVGSGLDVVYPRRHGSLWRAVAARGLVLSEHPLGVEPAAWHFPARNRLLAALADVVVVVESHERGGSLSTVREALARGREVLAVPGPLRSAASAGTNLLLRDGAGVCLGSDDVLAVLGLSSASLGTDRGLPSTPPDCDVLGSFGGRAASIEQIVLRTGRSPVEVASRLAELEADGWLVARGGWYEPR